MIKLKQILMEGKAEKAMEDLLSKEVKKSPFAGKVYIGGGYVRDLMLNLDPKDIDLVVASPDGGIKFAEWITKKYKVYKRGSNPTIFPKFGTAKFQLYGVKHNGVDISEIDVESVMTRTEKYTKGSRKPEVAVGTLAQDVERRDFTVNSLLKDLTTGEIKDLTGMGKADIKKGIIRTPLNPDIIFTEDPLRMLRGIRFAVKYGWDLPMFMIKAMKKNSDQLKNISSERIQVELDKMLTSKNPATAVRLLQMTGLNKHIAPELDLLIGLKQNKYHQWSADKHTLEVLKKVPPKVATRLAALFHDIGKSATKSIVNNEVHFYNHEEISGEMAADIMRRLKYPSDVISKVKTMIKSHMRLKHAGSDAEIVSDKSLRKLQRDLGDHLEDTLDLIDADNISHADAYNMPNQVKGVRKRLKNMDMGMDKGGKFVLPISGKDIMKSLNLKPGPMIGVILKDVEEAYMENPNITKSIALSIAKSVYKKYK